MVGARFTTVGSIDFAHVLLEKRVPRAAHDVSVAAALQNVQRVPEKARINHKFGMVVLCHEGLHEEASEVVA
jgi:hypothetical protein